MRGNIKFELGNRKQPNKIDPNEHGKHKGLNGPQEPNGGLGNPWDRKEPNGMSHRHMRQLHVPETK